MIFFNHRSCTDTHLLAPSALLSRLVGHKKPTLLRPDQAWARHGTSKIRPIRNNRTIFLGLGVSLRHVCVSLVRGTISNYRHKKQAEFDEPEADPLEAVFAMVHGVFVNVRFPLGASGKPNFADAWSAMIDK